MSIIKNINNKIIGIKKIIKITQTMKLISVSKINKIKLKNNLINIFIKKINKIILKIYKFNLNYKHYFYIKNKNIKKIIFILITTNKGFCGNINNNIFNLTLLKIKKFIKKGYIINIINIGNKGFFFLNKKKIKIILNVNINKNIFNIINKISKIINYLYKNNKIYSVYIIYTKFINTLKQIASFKKILPFLNFIEKKKKNNYIYEPNFKYLLNKLLFNYLKYLIYKIYIISKISEEYSRMINMHNANNNANNLKDKLNLEFNKNRQLNVTKELSEIISSTLIIN